VSELHHRADGDSEDGAKITADDAVVALHSA
jgi:hypothetical protein